MSVLNELYSKKENISYLARKYGANNLRVFGSVAREEEKAGSDIDLLADFETGRSYFDLVGLQQDLEGLLGRSVDILTPDSLHSIVKIKILKEARSIFDDE